MFDFSIAPTLTPGQILALRAPPALQARISELLQKNRTTGLLPEERIELDQYHKIEHQVGMAKARAALILKERAAE